MKPTLSCTSIALLILLTVSSLGDDAPRFRAASTVEPVVGRYLVTLAETPDVAMTTAALLQGYGGRLEQFAAEGFTGFMISLPPSRARALSADPRVTMVVEQLRDDEIVAVPAVAPAPAVAFVSAAVQGRPASNWERTPVAWKSGAFEYDGAGNIARIGEERYRYDGASRLTYATASTERVKDNRQTFRYDRYGNLERLETTSGEDTLIAGFAVTASTNQLTAPGTNPLCGPDTQLCFAGHYDEAGNQTGVTIAGEYKWDALGLMTETNRGRDERYVYDATDERVATIVFTAGVESQRRYTLRGPDNRVLRTLSYNVTTAEWVHTSDYVHGPAGLIASFDGMAAVASRHYHLDHLGSTRLVTDGAGYKLAFHTYWPFGVEAPGSDIDAERLKYTGHERDSSGASSRGFDLDYMHARYYNVAASRFLSPDPGKDWDKLQPQSWNLYAYVRNNPVNSADPTGRCVDSVVCLNYGSDVEVDVKGEDPGTLGAWEQAVVNQAIGQAALLEHMRTAPPIPSPAEEAISEVFPQMMIAMPLALGAVRASSVPVEGGVHVLSGHGGYDPSNGTTVLPSGTSFTIYARPGNTISDVLGNAIETGANLRPFASEMAGARSFLPGTTVPNLTLFPPNGLVIMGNPTTVVAPTTLNNLLVPNMGNVRWAACVSGMPCP